VLVSLATEEVTRELVPHGLRLIDRGEHRLRDIKNPERIFELIDTGNTAWIERPLRTAAAALSNIAASATTFIGRERERAVVHDMLDRSRLVTLVGPGGAGKTRLSMAVATDRLDHYRDGIWLVELARLGDPAQIVNAVLVSLGLRDFEPGQTVTTAVNDHGIERLERYLATKQMLLVLDNCEHMVTEAAVFADHLLTTCPQLTILATSREGLGIGGEALWPVPPLTQQEAIELMVERARSVAPSFELTADAQPLVAEICRRLDGLPLAIELAAAKTRTFALPELLHRLDDRFRLLTGGSRAALPRQQTLRAVVDWSYDLLDDAQRKVFERLSVFAGGCTLAAAEEVIGGDDLPFEIVAESIDQLVDKSLVLPVHDGLAVRYHQLQTLSQYGRERLASSSYAEKVRERHASYFLDLARIAEPIVGERGQSDWINRLDGELSNVRVALQWFFMRDRRRRRFGYCRWAWLVLVAGRSAQGRC
jgi:predicted ATPase